MPLFLLGGPMIDVEQTLSLRFPAIAHQPALVRNSAFNVLKKWAYQEAVNDFLVLNQDKKNIEFIDAVFDYFDFSYSVSAKDKAHIPAEGRVVIIANHPIGALDGLALLRLVSEVRKDVKVVANDWLSVMAPLNDLMIPIDNMGGGRALNALKKVRDALEQEQAVVVFPAGAVSRAGPSGVKDGVWLPGFLHFARKANAPILPVHIQAKNSLLFYGASLLFKSLGTALLPREMFKQQSRTLRFSVGELIAPASLLTDKLRDKTLVKRIKKHVYQLGKNKKSPFLTVKTIAHPEPRADLQAEFKQAELLGATRDGNCIYLVAYQQSPIIMREIGRLREVAFRRVGEGSGAKCDLDRFDKIYQHLVLWDRESLKIAGAYRIASGRKLMDKYGVQGFYTQSLYTFKPELEPYLKEGVELGRSFVNPEYWGKASLDYLWQGIGAYLVKYPARYLFGPVSMSADYPRELMDILVYFYLRYYAFGGGSDWVVAHLPYHLSSEAVALCEALFLTKNAEQAFAVMQAEFAKQGFKLPVLFKQYMAIYEPGGFSALAFSVDPDFGDCLDGFCMADLTKLKEAKRKRYMKTHPV